MFMLLVLGYIFSIISTRIDRLIKILVSSIINIVSDAGLKTACPFVWFIFRFVNMYFVCRECGTLQARYRYTLRPMVRISVL